jgi:hypothetical protein
MFFLFATGAVFAHFHAATTELSFCTTRGYVSLSPRVVYGTLLG